MLIKYILFSTFFIILIASYFSQKKIFSYSEGKILLTTIPFNNVDDEDVKKIRDESFFKFKILHFVFLILSLVMLITSGDFTLLLYISLIFGLLLSLGVLMDIDIKKMRKLKKEKNFATFTRKYVDIAVTKEIEKQSINLKMFLIPLIIFLIGYSFIGSFKDIDLIVAILCVSILLSMIFSAILVKKSSVKIISDDRRKNIYFNKLKIVKIQEKIFFISNLYAVLFLVAVYFSKLDTFDFSPIIFITALSLIFFTYFAYNLNKVDKEISFNIEDDKFICDEDEYYDIFGYKNPYDDRILVRDPINTGKFTVNRGNKKGKIIFSLMNVVLLAVIIFAVYGLTPATLDVKIDDKIKISTKMYSDSIEFSEIESIEMLEEFPKERAIRVNGVSTENQAYGNFTMKETGSARLYIYNKVKEVIKIKRKNKSTIFINMKTKEETVKLYEKLKNR